MLVFIVNFVKTMRVAPYAPANPWDGSSLEWATSSPPPSYNFPHIPVVNGRDPLWEHREELPVMQGLRLDDRELVLTSVVHATPDLREPSPKPTIWPFIAALTVTVMFVGSIFTPWAVVWGAIPVAIALTIWFWPKGPPKAGEPIIES